MVSLASDDSTANVDLMPKAPIRDAIVVQLTRELELQTRAALESREEATSVENKPEGQYDMRSQEAAYLAEGQARLAADIAESITVYQSLDLPDLGAGAIVAIGALVTLEAKGRKTLYFVGPRHGGLEARAGELDFVVVTPSSPLGRQLIGQTVGAIVHLPGRGGQVAHKIVAVV